MPEINEKSVQHLADLARLELDAQEAGKLTGDLGKILNYFEELQRLDTANVTPMTGGTALKNVFREDARMSPQDDAEESQKIVGEFPEKEGRYNKVPAVFE